MFKVLKSELYNLFCMMAYRISPVWYSSFLFQQTCHRQLNWQHPTDINEKINWLKFHGDCSLWSVVADKYRVRSFVEKRGLGHLLIPLYGHWENVEDIDWERLPNQFVMKTNNGSGDVLICKDKSTIDVGLWKKHFHVLLHRNYGMQMSEPHYSHIPPCILAEKLLDCSRQSISSTSMIDYKVWSFNGNPAYIAVYFDRTPSAVKVAIYDVEWHLHPEFIANDGVHIASELGIPRPSCLDDMLAVSSILSKGFPEVRVDLYEVDGKVYFGELTLTAAGGYITSYSQTFLDILGKHVQLPID